MRLLKNIFDFYLNASVHVALSVVALTGMTFLLLNIPANVALLGFAFFGTIVCYNFVKYGVEAEKYLIVTNAYHKYIQVFSFLSFGLALYFFAFLEENLWWAIIILCLLSTLYAIPFFPKSGNLRNWAGLKVYVVAAVWAGFTVLLPLMEHELAFTWDFWVLLLQRFVLVLILILPFEIRDLQWDAPGLRTIPQLLGIKKTKRLGASLTLFFFLLTFFRDEASLMEVISRFVLSLVLLWLFLSKNTMQSKYFASFWIEGLPLLWLGLFWGLRQLF